jgi:hypothetical protein
MVVFRTGGRALLGRRVFLGLLLLSWVPFLVRTVQIYLVAMYPQARQVVPVDAKMFESFMEYQGLFVFFITVYIGAGLIANDKRANALQVYLSKPILRSEYIGGKLGILIAYLSTVTLLPGLLLVFTEVIFSGNLSFLHENPFVLPAIILSGAIRVLVASITMLALSSMSRSPRYVAVMYAGVIFFTEAMYGVLAFVTGSTRPAWVSVSGNFEVINDAIFRQSPRYDTPVLVSVIVLVGLVVLSVSVLERQVRAVEVVG